MGVSFTSPDTGYLAGDENGIGVIILKTEDGGENYRRCNHSGYSILYMSIAMSTATNGIVAGIGMGNNFHGIEYTVDGNTFNQTADMDLIDVSQNVESIKGIDGGFGITGEFNEANGVAISLDQGVTWKNYDCKADTIARYGSFPSTQSWYISAGQWPEYDFHDSADPNIHVVSQKIRLHKGVGVEYLKDHPARHPSRRLLQSGYMAQIAKTADGGKTWQTVFNADDFYFNGIDCPSENHCFVVGESESDSPNPGCRILHTADGGATWEVQLYVNNSAYSLLDIAMFNETEGWATGGVLDEKFQGTYWHTSDGGKTWTAEEVQGIYGNALSFVANGDSYVGWSTAFTRSGQSSTLIYK